MAHRLAWLYTYGVHPYGEIDHINGDPSDNRICNLRDVPHVVNNQNLRKAYANKQSTSLLGAFQCRKRWRARIRVDGKLRALGTFDTAEEAHAAYVAAKRELHPGCTI